MGKKTKQRLRTHKIPPNALATGQRLMQEQSTATTRYNDWSFDTVAAMNIGDPKEGHLWLVDPSKGTVSEVARQRR